MVVKSIYTSTSNSMYKHVFFFCNSLTYFLKQCDTKKNAFEKYRNKIVFEIKDEYKCLPANYIQMINPFPNDKFQTIPN